MKIICDYLHNQREILSRKWRGFTQKNLSERQTTGQRDGETERLRDGGTERQRDRETERKRRKIKVLIE